MGEMKNSRKSLVRWAVIVACIAGVLFAVLAYRRMDGTIRNMYSVWWVADMVTDHLAANNDSWPRSWDDLHDDYEAAVKRSGRPWSFEELSQRVVVDWSVDTKTLKEAAAVGSEFRVIWLSDGTNAHWETREPNQMVRDYLRSRKCKGDILPYDPAAP
jgi:hypothetical protein